MSLSTTLAVWFTFNEGTLGEAAFALVTKSTSLSRCATRVIAIIVNTILFSVEVFCFYNLY